MTTIYGKSGLMLAAALAMQEMPMIEIRRSQIDDDQAWPPRSEPVNKGRRAEKDAIALAKAEAKRKRRADKRARTVTPNR